MTFHQNHIHHVFVRRINSKRGQSEIPSKKNAGHSTYPHLWPTTECTKRIEKRLIQCSVTSLLLIFSMTRTRASGRDPNECFYLLTLAALRRTLDVHGSPCEQTVSVPSISPHLVLFKKLGFWPFWRKKLLWNGFFQSECSFTPRNASERFLTPRNAFPCYQMTKSFQSLKILHFA